MQVCVSVLPNQELGSRSLRRTLKREIEMGRQMTTALYVVLMVAVIVGIDLLFFKGRFWERLMVNVGIVLVFAAFYFRFLKHP